MPPGDKAEQSTFRDAHYITFKADGIGELRVPKGDGAAKEDKQTGWNVVDRPRRIGLTVWSNPAPFRLAVPVRFEGFGNNDGQEERIGKLRRMSLPSSDGEPPIIEVSGHGIHNTGVKRWVIESITWGDEVIYDVDSDSGTLVRTRQDATVNLLQYVDEDRVAFSRLPAASPGGGAWPKHYTWKHGDTLQRVAAHFYHNAKKWRIIASANHVRDPKRIKAGRVLIIPKP